MADEAALYAKNIDVLLSDPERARALGRAGRELIINEYSWERSVEYLESLYGQLPRRTESGWMGEPDAT